MKKIIYGIVLLIIFLCIIAFVFNGFSFSEQCNVGNAFFDLPKNYQIDSTSIKHTEDSVLINITNRKNTISIVEFNDDNLEKYFKKYQEHKNNGTDLLEISNLTINNMTVRKSVDKTDNHFVHYWFIKNGKVYEIYTWDADEDFDENVEFMINSIHFF